MTSNELIKSETVPMNYVEGNGKSVALNNKIRDIELDVEEVEGVDDGLLPRVPPSIPPFVPRGPDINLYQQRKTLAQGMMDVALLTANANQLRLALERDDDDYHMVNVVLISLSISLQVLIGLFLIWNGSYDVNQGTQFVKANRVNNVTVIGIFVVTILNVFIASFGISIDIDGPNTIPVPANRIPAAERITSAVSN